MRTRTTLLALMLASSPAPAQCTVGSEANAVLAADPFELINVARRTPPSWRRWPSGLRELHEEWPATIPFACGVFDHDERRRWRLTKGRSVAPSS